MNIQSHNNLVKQNITVEQKTQAIVANIQNDLQISTKRINTIQNQTNIDNYKKFFDVDRYVRILKNMVIPPETRKDIAVLIELELKSASGISVSELQMLIDQVEKEEKAKKENNIKEI